QGHGPGRAVGLGQEAVAAGEADREDEEDAEEEGPLRGEADRRLHAEGRQGREGDQEGHPAFEVARCRARSLASWRCRTITFGSSGFSSWARAASARARAGSLSATRRAMK